MTSDSTPTTADELEAELSRHAKIERRLIRDQTRAERGLVKAAGRSEAAEDRLSAARARLDRAEARAAERRAELDVAILAVADARAARGAGPETERPPTSSG